MEKHPLTRRLERATLNVPPLTKLVDSITRVSEAVKFLEALPESANLSFVADHLQTENGFEVNYKNTELVPQEGPIVAVAPHIYPWLDGIALGGMLEAVRPNKPTRVVAVKAQENLPELQACFCSTDDLQKASVLKGFRQQEASLGMFPSGRYIARSFDGQCNYELPWEEGALRIAKLIRAKIVPIMIDGTRTSVRFNTARFALGNWQGLQNLNLRQVLRENVQLDLTMGEPLDPNDLEDAEALKRVVYSITQKEFKTSYEVRAISVLAQAASLGSLLPR